MSSRSISLVGSTSSHLKVYGCGAEGWWARRPPSTSRAHCAVSNRKEAVGPLRRAPQMPAVPRRSGRAAAPGTGAAGLPRRRCAWPDQTGAFFPVDQWLRISTVDGARWGYGQVQVCPLAASVKRAVPSGLALGKSCWSGMRGLRGSMRMNVLAYKCTKRRLQGEADA